MPFLTLNQIEVDVAVDTWKEEAADDVEGFYRGGDYRLQGSMYAAKRVWTFDTIPLTSSYAESLKGWIEARVHQWTFENGNVYSEESGISFTTGGTASTTQKKFGSYGMQVASAANTTFSVSFVDLKRSWSLWRRPSSGTGSGTWAHFGGVYDGSSEQGWSGTTTASLSGWYAHIPEVNGGLMALYGEDNAGSNAECYYDQVLMAPYMFTNSMMYVLGSRGSALLAPGFVEMDGDCIEDARTVQVRAKVEGHDTIETANGVFRRILNIKIWER